ncbi:MAG: hypothetical protein U0869_03880 [Chloroflexota bacterium]
MAAEAPGRIAPDLWRRMVKPRIAELYRYIHEHSRAKVFHSDGAISSSSPISSRPAWMR